MFIWRVMVIILAVGSAQASEMVSAVSAGMGGTGRAAAEVNESLYLNPAGIALLSDFHAGASYQSGFVAEGISRNTYSFTFTDATQGLLLPGSFAFRRHKINANGQRLEENEYKAGIGYRVTDRVSFGLGASHLRATDEQGQKFNQTNLDAGFLIGLLHNWGLSFSGENLLKTANDTPLALQRLSRVAIGTQYIFDHRVTFRYDTLMPLHLENTQLLGHRWGIGIMMHSYFFLNGGYSVDDSLNQNWTSVGLAWRGPRLKVAYSYQTEDRSSLGSRHLVDLWFDI